MRGFHSLSRLGVSPTQKTATPLVVASSRMLARLSRGSGQAHTGGDVVRAHRHDQPALGSVRPARGGLTSPARHDAPRGVTPNAEVVGGEVQVGVLRAAHDPATQPRPLGSPYPAVIDEPTKHTPTSRRPSATLNSALGMNPARPGRTAARSRVSSWHAGPGRPAVLAVRPPTPSFVVVQTGQPGSQPLDRGLELGVEVDERSCSASSVERDLPPRRGARRAPRSRGQ